MRRRLRWIMLLVLVLGTVGLVVTEDSGLLAGVKNSNRTDTWEFTLPIRWMEGQGIDFEGGSSIDINNDVGFGFGFGYNFNENFNLDFEFAWTDANYTVEFASADTPALPPVKATGVMDASNSSVNFTYNILPKTLTPYISAGIGWTWVDTNIPSGTPDVGCWWDPWYGQICTTYQDTFEDDAFSYGLGAGLRVEVTDTFFLRFGVNQNWQDFGGNYSDTPHVFSGRLDIAWKF